MNSDSQHIVSQFEVKIDVDWTGKELKQIMQKLAISIWNQI